MCLCKTPYPQALEPSSPSFSSHSSAAYPAPPLNTATHPSPNQTTPAQMRSPKIKAPFLGAAIRRIMVVFSGLYWGPPILGNYPPKQRPRGPARLSQAAWEARHSAGYLATSWVRVKGLGYRVYGWFWVSGRGCMGWDCLGPLTSVVLK